MVSCGFNLYFPDDMWSIFYVLVCDLNIFSGEVPAKFFGTFLNCFGAFLRSFLKNKT